MRPKTYVVTGSPRGIGRGIAEHLREDNWGGMGNYRSYEKASENVVMRDD